MKLIGHRGARHIVTENTVESVRLAMKSGLDAVEFDVRLTKDNVLVCHHDKDLKAIYNLDIKIKDHNFEVLRKATQNFDNPLNTFDEMMQAIGNFPLIIEIKERDCVPIILNELKRYKTANIISVASFNEDILNDYRSHGGKIPIRYNVDYQHTLLGLYFAKKIKAPATTLRTYNLWLPINIYLSRFTNLDVAIYPVNYSWQAKLSRALNPKISLIGDYPDRLKKF